MYDLKNNPLRLWSIAYNLKPVQLAIAASIDLNTVYACLNTRVARLPQSIIDTIDLIDGVGAGDKLNDAYKAYRNGLVQKLGMKIH